MENLYYENKFKTDLKIAIQLLQGKTQIYQLKQLETAINLVSSRNLTATYGKLFVEYGNYLNTTKLTKEYIHDLFLKIMSRVNTDLLTPEEKKEIHDQFRIGLERVDDNFLSIMAKRIVNIKKNIDEYIHKLEN